MCMPGMGLDPQTARDKFGPLADGHMYGAAAGFGGIDEIKQKLAAARGAPPLADGHMYGASAGLGPDAVDQIKQKFGGVESSLGGLFTNLAASGPTPRPQRRGGDFYSSPTSGGGNGKVY